MHICISGGIHFDGLIDTADGIAAGRKRQLEAMNDSNAGAIGVLSLISIILIQIASLYKLGFFSLAAIPIANFWGRASTLWAIEKFPYIKKTGMGKFHKDHWKGLLRESKPSLIIIISTILILLISPVNNLLKLTLSLSIIAGFIPAIWIPKLIGEHLGGHNGDSYGACVVLVETFLLFTLSMIIHAT